MAQRSAYRTPSLTIYGPIEQVLGAFGARDVKDSIFVSNGTVRGEGTLGSSDNELRTVGDHRYVDGR